MLEFLGVLLYQGLLLLGFFRFFHRKLRAIQKKQLLACLFFSAGQLLYYYHLIGPIFLLLMITGFVWGMIQGSLLKKSLALLLFLQFDLLLTSVLSQVYQVTLLGSWLYLIWLGILLLFFPGFWQKYSFELLEVNKKSLFFYGLLLGNSLFVLFLWLRQTHQKAAIFFLLLDLGLSFVVNGYLFYYLNQLQQIKKNSQTKQQQLRHYNLSVIENKRDLVETRKVIHDIKNYYGRIQQALQENQLTEAQAWLTELAKMLGNLEQDFNNPNSGLYMTLLAMIHNLKKAGAVFQYQLTVTDELVPQQQVLIFCDCWLNFLLKYVQEKPTELQHLSLTVQRNKLEGRIKICRNNQLNKNAISQLMNQFDGEWTFWATSEFMELSILCPLTEVGVRLMEGKDERTGM